MHDNLSGRNLSLSLPPCTSSPCCKDHKAAWHPCTLWPAAGGWGTHGEPLRWLMRLAKLCKWWVSSGKNIYNTSQLDTLVTLTDDSAHRGDQNVWHKIWLTHSSFPNTRRMYSTQLLWYKGSWEEESVARRKLVQNRLYKMGLHYRE